MNLVHHKSKVAFLLLAFCFIHIFLIGLIKDINTADLFYSIAITIIYILSYLSIASRIKKGYLLPIITILVLWIAQIFDLYYLKKISAGITFFYFFFIIVKLIIKVAKSKEVSILEFTESINAYLLFGIAGALIFRIIFIDFPGSFYLQENNAHTLATFIYFTFVTLSTLGFGDITPITPLARSISIFFSVAGQLYMAMIVAVLVGKYLSRK